MDGGIIVCQLVDPPLACSNFARVLNIFQKAHVQTVSKGYIITVVGNLGHHIYQRTKEFST